MADIKDQIRKIIKAIGEIDTFKTQIQEKLIPKKIN